MLLEHSGKRKPGTKLCTLQRKPLVTCKETYTLFQVLLEAKTGPVTASSCSQLSTKILVRRWEGLLGSAGKYYVFLNENSFLCKQERKIGGVYVLEGKWGEVMRITDRD